jgi:two-component sensor histidine kinase
MAFNVARDGKFLAPGEMDLAVRALVGRNHEISRVKVYSAPAVVIYSYPPGWEGEVLRQAGFWGSLQEGREFSKLKRKGMRSEEGITLDRDMLEVYIPIIRDGLFHGAFEVYYDLSREVSLVKSTLYKASAVMLVVAMIAFVVITFIMLRSGSMREDASIKKSMSIRSPSYHIFLMATSIFVAEVIIMIFLPVFPEMSRTGHALFDAFTLLILVSPLMYFIIFRPLSWAMASLERSEAKLTGLLHEKEGLMRDMIWRVQSNLNMVASMLSLHSRKLEDPAARKAVEDSQGRIRSMVLVYELLHRSMEHGGVKAREFLDSLTVRIMRGLNVDANRVRLMLEVDDIPLDVDTMVACGLMLNELLANSVRHAFPDDRKGEVVVSLKREPASENKAVFSVSDNGAGVPEGFDFSKDGGLGLTIVRALSGQLEGELRCGGKAGTNVSVVFSPVAPAD